MHSFLAQGERSGEDQIFSLHQEATQRMARGESVVNATIGVLLGDDGALAILPTAARVVGEVKTEEWAAYAPIAGSPVFLDAVMDDLFAGRPAMRESATAVATPGGTGAIRHVISTFLAPGQALLTTSFYWSPYATLADEHLRRVETFEMFEPGSDMGRIHAADLDRKLGEHLASQGRALLVINDPCHNPTGYSLTEQDWKNIADVVARHASRGPVAVVLDSAYAAYASTGVSVALSALEPLIDRALVLVAWSASKTFTHYGLRVGALVAVSSDAAERKRIHAALSYACRGTWSNCNRGGMYAVARLLREPALIAALDTERAALAEQLGRRVAVFNEHARPLHLRYPRYDGGFFVTVFVDDAFGVAARMRGDGVFVVPQRGAIRAALCSVASSNIPRLVASAAAAAASLQKTTSIGA